MCVLLLTVGVSVGVVVDGGDGASEVELGAMLVVSDCVREGEGEGEGEEEEGEGEGEGVGLGDSTTVKLSSIGIPEPEADMFMVVIFSVGSTEGVGEIIGVSTSCVELEVGVGVGVGVGTVEDEVWARMTGHRTRRSRRQGEEGDVRQCSDQTISNLQREGGRSIDIRLLGETECRQPTQTIFVLGTSVRLRL